MDERRASPTSPMRQRGRRSGASRARGRSGTDHREVQTEHPTAGAGTWGSPMATIATVLNNLQRSAAILAILLLGCLPLRAQYHANLNQ